MLGGGGHLVVIGLSAALHLGLLAYGLVQDKLLNLKYTDVDYLVYTQGADAIFADLPEAGGNVEPVTSFFTRPSPYLRSTYRYTPLMALFTTPNYVIGDLGGKLVFTFFSLLTGFYLYRLLALRGVEGWMKHTLAALWLLNPLVAQVSTRGNGDAILTCLSLATFYYVKRGRCLLAGLCLGTAIHLKIYPALYAFPLLVLINPAAFNLKLLWSKALSNVNFQPGRGSKLTAITVTTIKAALSLLTVPFRLCVGLLLGLNRHQWTFGLSALTIFGALTSLFYWQYGWTFLYETYLYHFLRHDHRHNFSPFSQWATLVTPVRYGEVDVLWPHNLEALKYVQKVSQWPLTLALSFLYLSEAPEISLFGATLTFVVFNSVSTAQYFLWYLSWFPLALTYVPSVAAANSSSIGGKKQRTLAWATLFIVVALWFGCEVHWLYWSYQLEFKGRPDAFLGLYGSTVMFAFASLSLLSFVLLGRVGVKSSQKIE